MNNTEKLKSKLGIKFNSDKILINALIHRSYVNENPDAKGHNERLEFLGDAVLELVVTDYLYKNYPNPEGELTNWRAALVNSQMLSKVANDIGLEEFILLSRGEAKDVNTKARLFILADALEALIGAIYLDQGYDTANKFISENIIIKLDDILKNESYIDAKSKFQEIAQAKIGITPNYQVLEESGPDHEKTFKIGVYLDHELVATGAGTSKREAQMDAAKEGLETKEW